MPGKEDFAETLRYYARRLEVLGVDVRLSTAATAADLAAYDDVIVATGVVPRMPDIARHRPPEGRDVRRCAQRHRRARPRVAVIGAGGIGVDVSVFLTHDPADDLDDWMSHWGVGDPTLHPGGLTERKPRTPIREVTLCSARPRRSASALGKTSGWAHRAVLKQSGSARSAGRRTTGSTTPASTSPSTASRGSLAVDHVVVCAGQESVRDLRRAERPRSVIGGADVAAELDAKRAIEQGTEVAAAL